MAKQQNLGAFGNLLASPNPTEQQAAQAYMQAILGGGQNVLGAFGGLESANQNLASSQMSAAQSAASQQLAMQVWQQRQQAEQQALQLAIQVAQANPSIDPAQLEKIASGFAGTSGFRFSPQD